MNSDDIINRLLRFNEFASFYHNEFKTKHRSTELKINPSCPMYGMALFDKKGNVSIQIRRLPDTIDDAFLVAHEMCHAMRYLDNQYIEFKKASTPIARLYKEEEIFDMGNKLGSMLDDPLIDSFLKDKYGFDSAHFYVSVIIPDTTRSLESYGDPPYTWHVFKKALFYAQFSLQWDSIEDNDAVGQWARLKEKYKICRPKVTRIGEELYLMSKENGYDSIEEQRRLFSKILDKYRIDSVKLGDILKIR